jgi:hypothetical protein
VFTPSDPNNQKETIMKYATRKNFLALSVLGAISCMTDGATAGAAVSEATAAEATEAAGKEVAAAVPPNSFKHSFYFRSVKDTPENREAIEKLGTVEEIEQEPGEPKTIRRATETYTFPLPVVNTGNEKLDVVMRDMIKQEIIAAAQNFVKKGEVPDLAKLSWDAIVDAKYTALTTAAAGDDSGSGFNAAFLKEVAAKFSAFQKNVGRDENGINVMSKMITGRFSVVTTFKYIKGLPLVKANLEQWFLEGCTEEEQTQYADVVQYLSDRCDEAMKPQEVETGSLFG